MIQTDIPCSRCDWLLFEIDFNRTHYMHLCRNPKCPIHRQPQGSRERDIGFRPMTGFFFPAPLPDTLSPKGLSSLPRGMIGKKAGKKKMIKSRDG